MFLHGGGISDVFRDKTHILVVGHTLGVGPRLVRLPTWRWSNKEISEILKSV